MQPFYKVESHLHTAETSKCGRISAIELVETYKALGYDAIAVTDHLHDEYIDLLYCRDDWDTCVDRFLDGYRRAKAHGETVGLHVILGAELRFPENENDYLIYGIDEAFLRRHPYPYRMGPERFFAAFGKELLIIHAHPYRNGNDFVRWDCVHGVEIANCSPRHANRNGLALAYALEHPSLYRLCGSDTHRPGDEGRGWMLFDQPVTDSFAFKAAVERGGYRLCARDAEEQAILREAEKNFRRNAQ